MRENRYWRWVRYAVVAMMFVVLIGCVVAERRPITPKAPLLPRDPAVIEGVLDNGLTYLLMKNQEPEKRVSMHLAVKSGSMVESDPQQGVAHFLEHMLFNGSDHFPPGELIKYFQRIGMMFGGDANAHTGFYETVYDVVLPHGDVESLAEGLLVMRDYAGGALLLESEVNRERGVILAEKRDRDSESYRNFIKSLAFELPGMRVNRRHPIGVEATIQKADAALLRGYYDTWYRPDNMAIVVVGDMDPEEVEGLIKARFASLSARAPEGILPETGRFTHVGHKAFFAHNPEAGSTSVTIEVLRYVERAPDTYEGRRQQLLFDMVSALLENRLDERVGKPGTPFTDGGVGTGTYLRNVRYGIVSAECPPDAWEESLKFLDHTLRSALAYGFTDSEVARVKKEMKNALLQAERTVATRNSRRLASRLIRSFTGEKTVVSPADTRRLFEPVVDAVTKEALHEILKGVWRPSHRLVMVEGNARIPGDESAAAGTILSAYEASRQVAASPFVAAKAAQFPYLPAPASPGAIASQVTDDALGLTTVTFENGVILHVKSTDFKRREVLYSLRFGEGLLGGQGLVPGLGALAEMVVNEGGLGRLDRGETSRAMAGTNTSFGYSVGQDGFSLSGRTTPEELSLMVQILYTQITDTRLKEDAYNLSRTRYVQGLEEMGRTVDGVLRQHGEAFLTGDINRFGYPDASLGGIDFQRVAQLVMPPLALAPLELSVVGDVPVDQVVDACAQWLGALPPRVAPERREVALTFPRGQHLSLTVASAIDKAVVTVAWPTTGMTDIHTVRRLSILGALFSERLRETVREELGAAYSPSAWNRSSQAYADYGVLRAMITVDPDQVEAVVTAVREIAETLRREPAAKDEIRRVVDPIVTHIVDFRRTNVYWLTSVMQDSSRHPEKRLWPLDILDDYRAITAGEVQRLATVYLSPDRAATITVRPGL